MEIRNNVKHIAKEYPVILTQDVNWGDMDAFEHVNNTVFFRYFEDARIAYFEKFGLREHMSRSNIGPILASALCNFLLPLDFPDCIHIGTRGNILSPKKLNMEFAVFSEKQNAFVAEGEGLVVYYDYTKGKSCEIPATIVAAIEALEAPQ